MPGGTHLQRLTAARRFLNRMISIQRAFAGISRRYRPKKVCGESHLPLFSPHTARLDNVVAADSLTSVCFRFSPGAEICITFMLRALPYA